MLERLVLPEIRELLAAHDHGTLSAVLNSWPPADVASVFARLSDDENIHLLRTLEPELAARTFEYLEVLTQERLLGVLTDVEAARILDNMAPYDRTALLEDLPGVRHTIGGISKLAGDDNRFVGGLWRLGFDHSANRSGGAGQNLA